MRQVLHNLQKNSGLGIIHKEQQFIINSEILSIDRNWIKNALEKYVAENHHLVKNTKLELHFSYQPVKKKIVQCEAIIKKATEILTAEGTGIDEYEALNDLLNTIDIELRINNYQQKPFFRSQIFTEGFNHLFGGSQYA